MTAIIIGYAAALVAFVGIDLVWLGWIARGLYLRDMGSLLRPAPSLPPAVAFYLLYAAGLMFFAVMPGVRGGSVSQAMLLGAALGLVAYGTYDLTSLSVINGFGTRIALIDMAWGTVLSGAAAAVASAVMMRFQPG